MQSTITAISLGGSLIAPKGVDAVFVRAFSNLVDRYLAGDGARKLIIVCGGGALARDYQAALRAIAPESRDEDLDWVGVAATRVNAELVRRALSRWCLQEVVTDPTAKVSMAGSVLVAAGWKPGWSTDYDAVLLARGLAAGTVINMSNLARVYSEDPKKNPEARPLDRLSWKQLRQIVGDTWTPGKNSPFDPSAARDAQAARIRVVFAGPDLANFERILTGQSYVGTTVGPD
jgi:uridylate kinase